MSKILITGTAGFIGYHLVKRLVQQNDNELTGVDNLMNTYYDINIKYARLHDTGIERKEIKDLSYTQSLIYPNYQFVKLDLVDKKSISRLFKEFRPDMVVSLAAQTGVRYSLDKPDLYIQNNIVGFFNILECCRHYAVKHLVYASSSSVYGNSTKKTYSEKDKTDSPISLYAATKKSNELMAYSYSHLYQIPSTGLRFFTVYGPYGRPDMAPMLFADAIMKGLPINAFNNGDIIRDFTYIEDIIEGIIRAMKQPTAGASVYNIGCGHPVCLFDFIHVLENTIGKKADIKLQPMQAGDVYQTSADTSALSHDFGYMPSVTLEEGVNRFIKWYKEYNSTLL